MDNNREAKIAYINQADLFIERLEKLNVSVVCITSRQEIIKEVHRYTVENQVNKTITITEEHDLTSLDWGQVNLATQYEPQALSTSVSFASLGIEESGSLLIVPSPKESAELNYFPEHHIVILDEKNIVKTIEDAWLVLSTGKSEFPSVINIITGPFRSINGQLKNIRHGSRYVHVILIKAESSE